ncbi:hypothetical protein ASG22_08865 [Chryseobacterium sp. Leaf405]|uniref:hypothetical protein n=1 Tax=Chryseobacterium sp. Leaf405 TaxID=1736367 RepID=UPI0006F509C8|nr:hypothetical protein [Chryseobacterium sp. Leaf405]KQT24117.1 hypothetical protein ASG22_08865 [Chryseobacterium sp. Leaf405]
MKKLTASLLLLSFGNTAYFAQVGINTQNPQTIFHVDGAKDNPAIGTPNAAQQLNDVVVTSLGRVGIGTNAPTNNLEVNSGTSGTSGVKLTQLPNAPVLSTDASGNIISNNFETAGVYVTKQRLILANPNIVINSGSGNYSFRYSASTTGGYWQMRINTGAARQFNTWDTEYYGINTGGNVWQGRYLQTINPNTWTSLDPNNAAGGSNEYNTMHVYDLGTGAIVRLTTTIINIGTPVYESLIVEEF